VQIDVIDNIASGFDIVDDSALVAATVRLAPGVPNKAAERSDSYGRPQGAVAIARHHHAGAVRADDIKATAF